jgi:hypothetical protein
VTPVDRLIRAWVGWRQYPASHDACVERLAAIRALGLHSSRTHDTIAVELAKGRSIPDAVQTVLNDYPHLREAS